MRNPEVWIVLITLGFLLFGAQKMPDAARGLGRSLRIFKSEIKGFDDVVPPADNQHSATAQLPMGQLSPAPQHSYQEATSTTAPPAGNSERRATQ